MSEKKTKRASGRLGRDRGRGAAWAAIMVRLHPGVGSHGPAGVREKGLCSVVKRKTGRSTRRRLHTVHIPPRPRRCRVRRRSFRPPGTGRFARLLCKTQDTTCDHEKHFVTILTTVPTCDWYSKGTQACCFPHGGESETFTFQPCTTEK
jgi:hypothetical protein